MQGIRQIAQNILSAADFPTEILYGIPIIEIHGNQETIIIHHKGVLSYDESEIDVSTEIGTLHVCGSELFIFQMNRERIVIHGRINSVSIMATGKC
jgi:sporulation protein YqfC